MSIDSLLVKILNRFVASAVGLASNSYSVPLLLISIEVFFSKLQRCFLKYLRVKSKEELINRLYSYIDELNKEPVVFRWKYKMNEVHNDMLFM